MIGNISGGQGADDLALTILRIAVDPKASEARLMELRNVEAGVKERQKAVDYARAQLDVDAAHVAERERKATQREISADKTEARQEARAKDLKEKSEGITERTVKLNTLEAQVKDAAKVLEVEAHKLLHAKQDLDALRAELNALKSSYESKLAALREVVK